MLSQALAAPTRSHDTAGTILIGGMLLLFSVLFPIVWLFSLAVSPVWIVLLPLAVFPPLLTLGYDLRVMEAGLRGERATPPFLEWTQLVRDGARSFLLGVVYFVPALLTLGAAGLIVAGAQTGQFEFSERVVTAVTGLTTAGTGVFVLLYIGVFLYIRPAALAVFVATGRLRAALSPRRVFRVALSTDYAIGWSIAAAVSLIGWTIAAPLQLLVIGFFFAFYVRAVSYYAYGSGARTRLPSLTETSLGSETVPREPATSTEPAGVTERVSTTDRATTSAATAMDVSTSTIARGTTSTLPNDERSLTQSWSPRIEPEPVASVQVGRSVSTPTDSDRCRTDDDFGRNDSGNDPETDGSPDDTREGDADGDTGTVHEADTDASRVAANGKREGELSVDEQRSESSADSSFEWDTFNE